MTEKVFLAFLANALSKGRLTQVSGSIDAYDGSLSQASRYIGGHSILPKDHDKISIPIIIDMGKLLLSHEVSISTKESILMILAHHPSQEALAALQRYNLYPDKELYYISEMALDECKMWNEE